MIFQDFTNAINQQLDDMIQFIESSTAAEAIVGRIGPAISLLNKAVSVKYLLRTDKGLRSKVFVIVPDFNIERDLAIMQLASQFDEYFDFHILPVEVSHMLPDDARSV